jgi:type II secretory pathway component PulJ
MTRVSDRPARARTGFTLAEAVVVSGLLACLAVLLARSWYGLVRPTADLAARARLAQEADLAAAALARDLGGSLANPEGRTGPRTLYPLVGRLQPGGSQLWLCFDGGSPPNGAADWGPPDTVIVYELQGDRLVRWDQNAGTTFTAARHVSGFTVRDLGGRVQIQLTFTYRGLTRTYTLVARDP